MAKTPVYEPPSEYLQQKQREALQRVVRSGVPCPSKLLSRMKIGERLYLVQAQLTQKSPTLEEATSSDFEGARENVRRFLKNSTPYGFCRLRLFWKLMSREADDPVYVCLSDMWAKRSNGTITLADRTLTDEEVRARAKTEI